MRTRIETPFDGDATADDVSAGVDLTGTRAVVTGGASGIGLETTRTLARRGAQVTVAVRDVASSRTPVAELEESTNSKIQVAHLDLTDVSSIRDFTASWRGSLHMLINNAGVMAIQQLTRSPEDWELQMATNYLGHFRLAQGLRPALAAADGARIVSVSSSGHLFSPVVFDDLAFQFRPYDPIQAYAQSKSAVNLFAVEASRRWADDGITVNALNPGAIATSLQRHVGGALATPVELRKTTTQGASTTVLLATSPLVDGVSGRYFNDNQEASVVHARPTEIAELVRSVAAYSVDEDNAERLWELTLRLVDE